MRYLLILFLLSSCQSYVAFSKDGTTIYTTHHRIPQSFCQRDSLGQYDIITPCCTGTYWDTTGLAQRIKDYNTKH